MSPRIISTGGDDTVRTRVYDMAAAVRPHNPIQWPEPYDSSGVASNDFTAKWHTREASLDADLAIRFGPTREERALLRPCGVCTMAVVD